MTEQPSRPDRVLFYVDAAGDIRWHRRNGHNGLITSESGEGYTDTDHAVEMAQSVNGGEFVLVFEALPANRMPKDGTS